MTRSWWNSKRVSKSRTHLGGRGRAKMRRGLTPKLERLEERCVLSGVFRTIDGSNNNDAHPDWGSAGEDLLRKGPAAYADGLNAPVVGNPLRPSPRLISDVIVAQTTDERELSDRFMSAMIYAWGQFVDHDLDLTPNDSPPEPCPPSGNTSCRSPPGSARMCRRLPCEQQGPLPARPSPVGRFR